MRLFVKLCALHRLKAQKPQRKEHDLVLISNLEDMLSPIFHCLFFYTDINQVLSRKPTKFYKYKWKTQKR